MRKCTAGLKTLLPKYYLLQELPKALFHRNWPSKEVHEISPPIQAHDTTAKDSQCTLRCLHYPALGLDTPRGSWRAGSHTDFSTVTLLYQVLLNLQ